MWYDLQFFLNSFVYLTYFLFYSHIFPFSQLIYFLTFLFINFFTLFIRWLFLRNIKNNSYDHTYVSYTRVIPSLSLPIYHRKFSLFFSVWRLGYIVCTRQAYNITYSLFIIVMVNLFILINYHCDIILITLDQETVTTFRLPCLVTKSITSLTLK